MGFRPPISLPPAMLLALPGTYLSELSDLILAMDPKVEVLVYLLRKSRTLSLNR